MRRRDLISHRSERIQSEVQRAIMRSQIQLWENAGTTSS
jgi:hypothetical protein